MRGTAGQAFVCGGTKGLGYSAAACLMRRDFAVVLSGRGQNSVDSAVKSLGDGALGVVLDVRQREIGADVRAALRDSETLVVSAGYGKVVPFLDTTDEILEATMSTNVLGAFRLVRAFVEARGAVGPGTVIFLTSQMAHVGGINRAAYCASKAAIEGFSRALCVELGPKGWRFVTVAPTFVETEMTRETLGNVAWKAEVERRIKRGRVGEPDEVGEVVAFLATRQAALINGSSVLVDGGWTSD